MIDRPTIYSHTFGSGRKATVAVDMSSEGIPRMLGDMPKDLTAVEAAEYKLWRSEVTNQIYAALTPEQERALSIKVLTQMLEKHEAKKGGRK